MSKQVHSKRAFIKKMAALAGFVAAADYTSTLISARSGTSGAVNDNNANDVNLQAKALRHKQFVLMTDDEKKQMLEEILNGYNKNRA